MPGVHDQLLGMLEQGFGTRSPRTFWSWCRTSAPMRLLSRPSFQQDAAQLQPARNITLADEHPLVATFLQLLRLPRSRFTGSEISPCSTTRRCAAASVSTMLLTKRNPAIDRARAIPAGASTAAQTELDLPATEGNTWQQARERFFAGFACSPTKICGRISHRSDPGTKAISAPSAAFGICSSACRYGADGCTGVAARPRHGSRALLGRIARRILSRSGSATTAIAANTRRHQRTRDQFGIDRCHRS